MLNSGIINVLKYSLIIFVIIIMVILLKGVNYRALQIDKTSVGQGWYFFYEYVRGEKNFSMTFGKIIPVLSIILGLLVELLTKFFIVKLKKIKINSNVEI